MSGLARLLRPQSSVHYTNINTLALIRLWPVLTTSNPVHIWLDIIQMVAMVLLPLQWRGAGWKCAAGKTEMCSSTHGNESVILQPLHVRSDTILNISVHAHFCLFIFRVSETAQLYTWQGQVVVVGGGGVAVCRNARPWICLLVQPCIPSSICSSAALPAEWGWAVTHSRTFWHDSGEQHGARSPEGPKT